MIGVAPRRNQSAGIAFLIEHGIMHCKRRAYARFVIQQLLHGDTLLCRTAKSGYVFRRFVGKTEQSHVVGFHDSRKCAESFGHRRKVVDRGSRHLRTSGRGVAIAAAEHHVAATGHENLTSGKCARAQPYAHYRVNAVSKRRAQAFRFRHSVAQTRFFQAQPCALLIQAFYGHGQFSVHINASENSLSSIFTRKRCVVVSHQNGRCTPHRCVETRHAVGIDEKHFHKT